MPVRCSSSSIRKSSSIETKNVKKAGGERIIADSTEAEIQGTATPPQAQSTLMMKRGRTTFLIDLHFSENSPETLKNKVVRMIQKDVQNINI
ncbi:MAG: transposon-encoded TnpW family protein [Oscillospiraceae bacterium]|nr:transposon-encoded TnpW family protein [Oscillospiraceae bacterium]